MPVSLDMALDHVRSRPGIAGRRQLRHLIDAE
jgi:hypothetical protein